MSFYKKLVSPVFIVFLAACAGQDPHAPPQTAELPESNITSSPEEAPTRESGMSSRVRGPAEMVPAISDFQVSAIEETNGENGRGQTVPAVRPVALDVIASAWPGRALDPVLFVGQELRFQQYRHPSPGILRFVAADANALPTGAPVWLQYGNDPSSRVVVVDSLEVPR